MLRETLKPWGNEILIHQGHGYAVKIITLHAGMSTSLHYHEVKHETIFVHSGSLTVSIGTDSLNLSEKRLGAGEHLAIEPQIVHRMTAKSQECIYFEAQSDFLDDVIRIIDEHSGAR